LAECDPAGIAGCLDISVVHKIIKPDPPNLICASSTKQDELNFDSFWQSAQQSLQFCE
jgi:hypothetical protein